MESRSLREIVEELESSLAEATDLPEEERAELEEAVTQIRRVLEGEAAAEGGDPLSESLRSRLSQALTRFEGSHPKLTATVGRLLDQLAEFGI